MHDTDVNALAAELDGDRRGELRHVGLGRAVRDGEGVGDVCRRRRRENDGTAQALLEHERGEMVRDAGGRDGVAIDESGVMLRQVG